MPSLDEINRCSPAEFTTRLGGVFEHSPHFAARAAQWRPFASLEALHAAFCRAVREAPAEEQLALIGAHPDLVGRAVLTAESQGEQAAAGLTDLTPEEVENFRANNAAYREKFGFPFVICARLNKKQAILEAFPRRLANSRAEEVEAALAEICKIARFRLEDALSINHG